MQVRRGIEMHLYNHPVERTAHSTGSVLRRGAIPVGRRSPGALGDEISTDRKSP